MATVVSVALDQYFYRFTIAKALNFQGGIICLLLLLFLFATKTAAVTGLSFKIERVRGAKMKAPSLEDLGLFALGWWHMKCIFYCICYKYSFE